MICPSSIFYLVNALEYDSPTKVMAQITDANQKRGNIVTFAAWQRGATEPTQWNATMNIEGISLNAVPNVSRSEAFIKLYRDVEPNVVHTTLVRPTLVYAWLRRRHKLTARWIITHHGTHEWKEKAGGLAGFALSRLMPYVYNQADAIATPSNAARDDLAKAGVNPAKISVIPNGIEMPQEDCPYDSDCGDNRENAPLIASAGNLRPVKGYDVFIEALPAVIKAIPLARARIWGEGPERLHLEKRICQLGLQDIVSLPGYTPQWMRNLDERTLYVQPSRDESFGLAAAEAMLAGMATVVTDAGGLPELVDHGRAGLIVPSGDPGKLADAIIQILQNPTLHAQLGESARQRIIQQYSHQSMITSYFALYDSFMETKQ